MEAIRNGDAGLNDRRKGLLSRVPNSNDWAAFERESITVKDIAYLSAATHHEFYDISKVDELILTSGDEWPYSASCNVKMSDGTIEFLECRIPS